MGKVRRERGPTQNFGEQKIYIENKRGGAGLAYRRGPARYIGPDKYKNLANDSHCLYMVFLLRARN